MGLETILTCVCDCRALRTRRNSLAEKTALSVRAVPSLFTKEASELKAVLAVLVRTLLTSSVTELVEPDVLLAEPVVPSVPVEPVVEVGVTTPPVEVTELELLEPDDWVEPLVLEDSLVVPAVEARVVAEQEAGQTRSY